MISYILLAICIYLHILDHRRINRLERIVGSEKEEFRKLYEKERKAKQPRKKISKKPKQAYIPTPLAGPKFPSHIQWQLENARVALEIAQARYNKTKIDNCDIIDLRSDLRRCEQRYDNIVKKANDFLERLQSNRTLTEVTTLDHVHRQYVHSE